jgi:hypothetical protein
MARTRVVIAGAAGRDGGTRVPGHDRFHAGSDERGVRLLVRALGRGLLALIGVLSALAGLVLAHRGRRHPLDPPGGDVRSQ